MEKYENIEKIFSERERGFLFKSPNRELRRFHFCTDPSITPSIDPSNVYFLLETNCTSILQPIHHPRLTVGGGFEHEEDLETYLDWPSEGERAGLVEEIFATIKNMQSALCMAIDRPVPSEAKIQDYVFSFYPKTVPSLEDKNHYLLFQIEISPSESMVTTNIFLRGFSVEGESLEDSTSDAIDLFNVAAVILRREVA